VVAAAAAAAAAAAGEGGGTVSKESVVQCPKLCSDEDESGKGIRSVLASVDSFKSVSGFS